MSQDFPAPFFQFLHGFCFLFFELLCNKNFNIYFNHRAVVASWLLNYSSFPEEFQL